MRTTPRKLGVHVFLLLVTLYVGGSLSTVSADPATFSGDLTVNLIFPAPSPGSLAVAVGAGPVLPLCVIVTGAPAGGSCGNAFSTFVAAANTLTFTTGPILGLINPGGSVFVSSAGVSHTISLTNLTPFGLIVPLGGNFNYSLVTTAVPGEFANASVFFQITNPTTGAVLFGPIADNIASPPNAAVFAVGQFAFNLVLPPGATDIRIDAFVEAQASSVPEPTALILLSTGLAGVAIKTRKKLKNRKSG